MADGGTVPAPVVPHERVLAPLGVAALALGLLLLLGMTGATVRLAASNADGIRAVERTGFVRRLVPEVAGLVEDAETGQRGFLLTGEDAYLDPYDDAVRRLPERFSAPARMLPGEDGERAC